MDVLAPVRADRHFTGIKPVNVKLFFTFLRIGVAVLNISYYIAHYIAVLLDVAQPCLRLDVAGVDVAMISDVLVTVGDPRDDVVLFNVMYNLFRHIEGQTQ